MFVLHSNQEASGFFGTPRPCRTRIPLAFNFLVFAEMAGRIESTSTQKRLGDAQ
jgi:hypothetical protein